MTETTTEAEQKLAEVERISAQIVEAEVLLGIDPTHKRGASNNGLYQQRLRLYDELRHLGVPYPTIGEKAGTSGESVRAAIHKRKRRT